MKNRIIILTTFLLTQLVCFASDTLHVPSDQDTIPRGRTGIIYSEVLNEDQYLPEDLYPLHISGINSSGHLNGSRINYLEQRMTDDDPTTWWVPTPFRSGEGAWIEIRLKKGSKISGFQIWPGSHKEEDPGYFYKNNRIKGGTCFFSNGTSVKFELSDEDRWQYVQFDREIVSGYMRLKIETVYPGNRWNDLCVSELVPLTADVDQSYMDGGMEKPVIYLYPEKKTNVHVRIQIPQTLGKISISYPEHGEKGWDVFAYPDGTIIDNATNKTYQYLFWEGFTLKKWKLSDGFIVKKEDAASFLEEKLSYMGLIPKEYNDFIVYWLPRLQQNDYNVIRFVNEEYEEYVPLIVDPKPDSFLRIFMVFKKADASLKIPEQKLSPYKRNGYTIVEWGGAQLK
jgi:hypothetical protein